MFAIIDAVYLRPLPYGEVDKLYLLEGTAAPQGQPSASTNTQNLLHIQREAKFLQHLAICFSWSDYKLTEVDGRPNVPVMMASANFFEVMQVQPVKGRFFNQEEQLGNKQPSAILSYQAWQAHFDGDPAIVGQNIQLDQRRFKVIGITPDELVVPELDDVAQAIWLPLDMDENMDPKDFGGFSSRVKAVTRLAPTASYGQGVEEIIRLNDEATTLYHPPEVKQLKISARLSGFASAVRRDSGKLVSMLVVGVVLLASIALVNLSSMQLARAINRQQPMAVSYAFGATRKQLFLEIFQHNGFVIGAATLIALLLTVLSFGVIRHLGQEALPRMDTLGVSLYVLLFVLIAAVLVTLLLSWAELKGVAEQNLHASLQGSGKGTGKQIGKGTTHALIGLQLAFSLLTLTATSQVLLATLAEALRPTQINTEGLWNAVIDYTEIDQSETRINLQRAVMEKLSGLPGVQGISRSSETRVPEPLNIDMVKGENGRQLGSARQISVDERQLPAFGLSIEGRDFNRDDMELEYPPVIINQRLAKKLKGNPLGQKLVMSDNPPQEIVGVARNTDFPGGEHFEWPEVYIPQHYDGYRNDALLLQVNSAAWKVDDGELLKEIVQIDPRLDVQKFSRVADDFSQLGQAQRFAAWLAGALGLISLLMVAAGIAGIVSYSIGMRRYDLGVKMAMGATQRTLLRNELQDLALPILSSLLFSVSLSYWFIGYSRTVPELGFEVYWGAFFAVLIFLAVLAAVACVMPIRKVLVSDPVKALRNE